MPRVTRPSIAMTDAVAPGDRAAIAPLHEHDGDEQREGDNTQASKKREM